MVDVSPMFCGDQRRTAVIRVAVIVAAVAAVLAAIPATPAAADESGSVTFTGSGWGHGVGLSQYGAYGMAREGATYDEIVGHFFTGAAVGVMGENGIRAKDDPSHLWVNLEKDFAQLTLEVLPIGYYPPKGDPVPMTLTRGEDSWVLQPYDKLEIAGTDDCALTIVPWEGDVVEIPSGPCEFDMTWNGFEVDPTTKIEIDGCYQTDWNQVPTNYSVPCQYGRGMLHLRSGPGGLDLSLEIDIDDYIRGISEMPYYWGDRGAMEALKAQAIASRSYARELQLHRGTPGDNSCGAWCHVRDTTFDQRYVGWGHGGSYVAHWIEASQTTAGMVLTHPAAPNDTVVRAYYSSSSGGLTENIHEVWTWWSPREYYSSVDDRWSADPAINPNASWTAHKTGAFVAAAVGLTHVTDVAVVSRNTSGSARDVEFTGIAGDAVTVVTKNASWVRSTFGLKSITFDVTTDLPDIENPHGDPPSPSFRDVAGSPHLADILWIADEGITKGCNPPVNDLFCPTTNVSRGQMAAFLVRALTLPASAEDYFDDDAGSVFENDINRLAAAGITKGCGTRRFCPDAAVSRGEMAAFLVRALGYTDDGGGNHFVDDDASIFEGAIDRLRTAGVTLGCNPPANDRFCPDDPVRRDHMASFLARALR